jgi:hypothetical protein
MMMMMMVGLIGRDVLADRIGTIKSGGAIGSLLTRLFSDD